MTLQLITTPTRQHEIARQEAWQRHRIADQADPCVRWLKVQGFRVLRVERGALGPRVIINDSPLCKHLEGVVAAYERGPEGERRYSFVRRMDCEVRWYHDGEASNEDHRQ